MLNVSGLNGFLNIDKATFNHIECFIWSMECEQRDVW